MDPGSINNKRRLDINEKIEELLGKPKSIEWYKRRRGEKGVAFGSSEIGQICDWTSAARGIDGSQEFFGLLMRESQGIIDVKPDNDFSRHGNYCEPIILEYAGILLGAHIEKSNEPFISEEYPDYFVCQPDGLVTFPDGKKSIIEVKAPMRLRTVEGTKDSIQAASMRYLKYIGQDKPISDRGKVPRYVNNIKVEYICQMMFQMFVTKNREMYFCACEIDPLIKDLENQLKDLEENNSDKEPRFMYRVRKCMLKKIYFLDELWDWIFIRLMEMVSNIACGVYDKNKWEELLKVQPPFEKIRIDIVKVND